MTIGQPRETSYSSTSYSWDVLDQMTKVDGTAAGSEAWIHIYNPAGERIWSWRTSGNRQDTYAVRDPGGKVLTLFTKLPGTIPTYTWEDYVYREGQLLAAKMSDGAVKHFDLDHLGSVRLETDGAEAVLAYREFWPYGEETTPPTATERMKFTGHERDLGVLGSDVDDLDYMHARYYRPLVGRFLSLDPVNLAGSSLQSPQRWSRYAYASANPLMYIDPDGRVLVVASGGRSSTLMTFLARTAMRPSGRSAIQGIATSNKFTLTIKDGGLNSQAEQSLARDQKNSYEVKFGRTNAEVRVEGTSRTNIGATMVIDTKAVTQQHYSDKSGVSTTAHEIFHASEMMAQKPEAQIRAGDLPSNSTGPAAIAGDFTAQESSDMTEEQARTFLEALLKAEPPV